MCNDRQKQPEFNFDTPGEKDKVGDSQCADEPGMDRATEYAEFMAIRCHMLRELSTRIKTNNDD